MTLRRRAILALLVALIPAASAAGEGGEKKKGGGASYIQLGAVTATAVRSNGRRGVLTVETGIDVPNPILRAKAQKVAPRLTAAFVQAVQIYASGLPAMTAPNTEFLSRELQRQTDLTLGERGARLLLGSVMVN